MTCCDHASLFAHDIDVQVLRVMVYVQGEGRPGCSSN
jgi:hypothetical protein